MNRRELHFWYLIILFDTALLGFVFLVRSLGADYVTPVPSTVMLSVALAGLIFRWVYLAGKGSK